MNVSIPPIDLHKVKSKAQINKKSSKNNIQGLYGNTDWLSQDKIYHIPIDDDNVYTCWFTLEGKYSKIQKKKKILNSGDNLLYSTSTDMPCNSLTIVFQALTP